MFLVQGFYLGKYEVTQAQYEAVMTGNSVTQCHTEQLAKQSEPPCRESFMGGYTGIPYPFKFSGGRQYPRRVGVCVAYGSPVGICLPGRHVLDIFVGSYNHFKQCQLQLGWWTK